MVKLMEKQKQITSLLSALGISIPEIVSSLKDKKIFGYPAFPMFCPIAKYLSSNGIDNVSVFDTIDIYEEEFSMKTPISIFGFIQAFDRGDFPELIKYNIDNNKRKENE